ncbi:MAG: peptide chain release factor 1 [Theionarchaea archaeon]|nr:peptide chain release factor 1 [Theionarchaea archaeon]MBU7000362.1 peptide chain release factor 1 [Theionarchaea archaeon]MBU7020644.1 peptide chain release factor 1 [Theionarchaea archaeon]
MKKKTEQYKFKKMLDHLSSYKGRHTELVSLYVPAGYEIPKVAQQIRDEQGTAVNIKSTTTRKNVLGALEKVAQHLTLFREPPPNGLVIFCGNVSEREGVSDIQLFSFEPLKPLSTRIYRCDQEFVLEPLYDMLEAKEVYGLLIVERNEATVGLLKGKSISMVDYMTSGVPGKTRAGGQSAHRFERLRDAADHEFRKRIAEHANRIFLDEKNLSGILVGGPGHTKNKFIEGEFLHHELQKKVIGIVDTSYNGEYGLRELVERGEDILQNLEMTHERDLVQQFLRQLVNDEPVTYGEKEVRYALQIGAVETVLLSEDVDLYRVKIKCEVCNHTEEVTLSGEKLRKLREGIADSNCPQCGNVKLVIKEEKELIEDFTEMAEATGAEVELISTETEEGSQLFKAFGGIAAMLRFKVEQTVLP